MTMLLFQVLVITLNYSLKQRCCQKPELIFEQRLTLSVVPFYEGCPTKSWTLFIKDLLAVT